MSKLPTPDDKAPKTDKCTPSGTTLPEGENSEFQAFENNELQVENGRSRVVNSSPKNAQLPTARRKRTVRAAKKIITESSYPNRMKPYAYARIRKAKQPVREARAIVEWHRTQRLGVGLSRTDIIDLSDAQELRVKLFKRDYGIWPPHSDYLGKIEIDILSGEMTPDEFKRRSAVLLSMEQSDLLKITRADWLLILTSELEVLGLDDPSQEPTAMSETKYENHQFQYSLMSSAPSSPLSPEENKALLDIPDFLKRSADDPSEDSE